MPLGNGTNDSQMPFPLWETVLIGIIEGLSILITLCGNVLVILAVFSYRPLRNCQNFLIVSLAVSDLSVAILLLPFSAVDYLAGRWVFGSIFCDIWLSSDIFFCTASILNLCAIALDRYFAIRCPIAYATRRTLRTVLVMIAAVYVLSALISIPPLFGWKNDRPDPAVCRHTDQRGFVVYSAMGSFFLPGAVMGMVYLNVYLAIRKRLRHRSNAAAAATASKFQNEPLITKADSGGTNLEMKESKAQAGSAEEDSSSEVESQRKKPPKSSRRSLHKGGLSQFISERQKISLSKERKAARTLGIIMATFILCWLPFFGTYIIVPFCGLACTANIGKRFENFITWLGYVNSALNPIIYTIFNNDFRTGIQRLVRFKK